MTTSASRTTESAVAAGARRGPRAGDGPPDAHRGLGVLVVVAIAILFPLVYAVLGGFKTNGELAANPGTILPNDWVFTNYTDVLFGEYAATFWRQALNSVIVATIAVVLTVALASAAAFAFARMRVPRPRSALHAVRVRPAVPLGRRDPAAVHPRPPAGAVRATSSALRCPRPRSPCRSRSSSCGRSSGASRSSSRTPPGSTAAARSGSSGGSCCRWPGRRSRP